MFKEERDNNKFSWADLGDLKAGRPNLGPNVSVIVYRLLQYTIRDVLISSVGVEMATEIFVKSGKLAGEQFCLNVLDKSLPFDEFVSELQRILKEQLIGILRIEKADLDKMEFVLTVAEDLDCSGLPFEDETVCQYDEGFIAGILGEYTGKTFFVKEVDCWASGDRVCRFEVKLADA